jgi:CheY-like chemotaxis protein
MDGWSVLQKLKSDPELKEIPVFIVSVVDNKPLAFSLGVQDYLMKPFSRDQLLGKLHLVRRDRIRHALIVDDDASVRAEITEVLLEEGYDIEAIDSGEVAIRRLNHVQPDLLLLDLAMPHVSGFDVLAAIEPLQMQEMATIVMTDEKLSHDQEAFLERRVQAIVEKKFATLSELAQRIRKTLPMAQKAA